ncbi:SDR family oxidoreductase [Pseudaminobacter sp. 19-2017]|uniref:SDR family oxidoreductase n=1 Tax=Pseudaminobacter soli (ex Zhang et al. 2022) TaxID=2831468 RepID=A0A942DZE0_9HYPH|nr:SDR family oxidoreductase [Pseudaminobacter soli]MBS3648191.1 SDR family oxidoreductase [Pseudaminobacter soli]
MRHSAVVTGGASGIGKAVVKRLLEDGWPVAVVDSDRAALAEAEAAFSDENAIFLLADVTDDDEIADVFDQAVDSLGLIGGLVNCSAMARDLPVEETSAEFLRQMLDVNLVGSFITSRAALERMGESLAIVNMASVSGMRADRGRAAYGASKAGLKLMSEVLALEYGPAGVRVNCVAPGHVETSGVSRLYAAEHRRSWLKGVPQGRYGEPEEIAAPVAFLLSPEASYINGHTLVVDGGFLSAGVLEDR